MSFSRIYLAGGCFWGMQAYFSKLSGIIETSVGYANGKTADTSYKKLKETDHAETLEILYDKNSIRLEEILLHYFKLIDPLSINKQGEDEGRQYRTGIYYLLEEDAAIIYKICSYIEYKLGQKIVVEVEKLREYILAEDYHQNYLEKNPKGYCHINLMDLYKPLFNIEYKKPELSELRNKLTPLEFSVTQESHTERPFSSEYEKNYEEGIYVNVVTGEPLFLSEDKYDSGCGWPSFTRTILTQSINYLEDSSYGMNRIEVKTSNDGAHLGHVFDDGPIDKGSKRYCINGSALRFIPYNKMEEYGYEDYKIFFKKEGLWHLK